LFQLLLDAFVRRIPKAEVKGQRINHLVVTEAFRRLDRELEQVELAGMEGITTAELIAAAPAVEVDRIIAETVERLKIILLAVILVFPLSWEGSAQLRFFQNHHPG